MVRPVHITRTVDVHLTPTETAAEFCELHHEDQAKVLVEIARLIDGYETVPRNLVPLYIGRELFKNSDGARAMELLSEILNWYGPSTEAKP